jgi:HD-like signal output (HDOD) protein
MYDTLIQEYEGQFGRGRSVDEVVECVDALPPMPSVISRALRLVDDFNATPDDMADVISMDPALASPVLRMANSASAGQQQEVSRLADAIMVVGLKQIKSMLYGLAMRRWNRNFGPVEKMIWQKSLGGASAAHVLCEQLKKRYKDELYLTGLLHNLGQIVLLSHAELGESYKTVVQRLTAHNEDYVTAEREVIGFSHPLVGALVARKWGLPLSTCQAILHYADPFEGIDREQDEITGLLKLAVGLGFALGFGKPEGHFVDMLQLEQLAGRVGFNPDTVPADLSSALCQIKKRFAAEASAYA